MAVTAMSATKDWFLYLVRCADGSLYTGVATDVERRLGEHRATSAAAATGPQARGAKFFRGKGQLQLVFSAAVADRSMAQKLEYKVKQLHKSEKEALVAGKLTLTSLLD